MEQAHRASSTTTSTRAPRENRILTTFHVEEVRKCHWARISSIGFFFFLVSFVKEGSLHPTTKETGKKKKKPIEEILRFPKQNSPPITRRTTKKGKSAIFRSTAAAIALSVSISEGGVVNRNRILLNESQAAWTVNKMLGLSYDVDEEEVISKIYEMEIQDEERAAYQL